MSSLRSPRDPPPFANFRFSFLLYSRTVKQTNRLRTLYINQNKNFKYLLFILIFVLRILSDMITIFLDNYSVMDHTYCESVKFVIFH